MELEYTSAGCNRCVGNVTWNDEGIVAFGSHRVVVLYDIEVRPVVNESWLHGCMAPEMLWIWWLILQFE